MTPSAPIAVCLLGLWLGAADAWAQEMRAPSFRSIADTRGNLSRISHAPCANGRGALVFHGFDRAGREAIYYSAGGVVRPVLQVGNVVPDGPERHTVSSLGAEPGLSAGGLLVVSARFLEGEGVLSRDGPFGPLEFVADSGEAFRSFGPRVEVNAEGDVLFHAVVDPYGHPDRIDDPPDAERSLRDVPDDPKDIPPETRWTKDGLLARFDEGLFVEDGEFVHTVGGTRESFIDVSPRAHLTPAGGVVYRAWSRVDRHAIVYDDGFSFLTTIAETGRLFRALGDPAANARGDIVFFAEQADGTPVIAHGRRGRATPAVWLRGGDTAGFRAQAAVDPSGRAFAVATESGGKETLVSVTAQGEMAAWLRSGDPMPRPFEEETVRSIHLGPRPFIDPRTIALRLTLAPAGEAVILLDVSPTSTH